jgi:hypothetical protein
MLFRWILATQLCVLTLGFSFAPHQINPLGETIKLRKSSNCRPGTLFRPKFDGASLLLPRNSRLLVLKSADDDTGALSKADEKARRDELLKKLAGTDAPKSSPKPTSSSKEPELPAWFYIAVPLSGALLALAIQLFTNKPLPVG